MTRTCPTSVRYQSLPIPGFGPAIQSHFRTHSAFPRSNSLRTRCCSWKLQRLRRNCCTSQCYNDQLARHRSHSASKSGQVRYIGGTELPETSAFTSLLGGIAQTDHPRDYCRSFKRIPDLCRRNQSSSTTLTCTIPYNKISPKKTGWSLRSAMKSDIGVQRHPGWVEIGDGFRTDEDQPR